MPVKRTATRATAIKAAIVILSQSGILKFKVLQSLFLSRRIVCGYSLQQATRLCHVIVSDACRVTVTCADIDFPKQALILGHDTQ